MKPRISESNSLISNMLAGALVDPLSGSLSLAGTRQLQLQGGVFVILVSSLPAKKNTKLFSKGRKESPNSISVFRPCL